MSTYTVYFDDDTYCATVGPGPCDAAIDACRQRYSENMPKGIATINTHVAEVFGGKCIQSWTVAVEYDPAPEAGGDYWFAEDAKPNGKAVYHDHGPGTNQPGGIDGVYVERQPDDALTMDTEALRLAIAKQRGFAYIVVSPPGIVTSAGAHWSPCWPPNWPSSWADAGPLWYELVKAGLEPQLDHSERDGHTLSVVNPETLRVKNFVPDENETQWSATEAISRAWLYAKWSGWLDTKEVT